MLWLKVKIKNEKINREYVKLGSCLIKLHHKKIAKSNSREKVKKGKTRNKVSAKISWLTV